MIIIDYKLVPTERGYNIHRRVCDERTNGEWEDLGYCGEKWRIAVEPHAYVRVLLTQDKEAAQRLDMSYGMGLFTVKDEIIARSVIGPRRVG